MFVIGGENEGAPAVVNMDAEEVVVDLVEQGFRDSELVVETVAVGREGVRQHEVVFARRDDVLCLHRASTLGGGDGVGAFVFRL